MTAFVDTYIIIRHLAGDPREQAQRASRFLREAEELLLTDVIVAETVYGLEPYHQVPRERLAELIRAVITFLAMVVLDEQLLLRAVEVYEVDHRSDPPSATSSRAATAHGDALVVRTRVQVAGSGGPLAVVGSPLELCGTGTRRRGPSHQSATVTPIWCGST